MDFRIQRNITLTLSFSPFEIPAFFNSASLKPHETNHNGSFSLSHEPSNLNKTDTKSDFDARSGRSRGSLDAREAKNTRMVSKTYITR